MMTGVGAATGSMEAENGGVSVPGVPVCEWGPAPPNHDMLYAHEAVPPASLQRPEGPHQGLSQELSSHVAGGSKEEAEDGFRGGGGETDGEGEGGDQEVWGEGVEEEEEVGGGKEMEAKEIEGKLANILI